MLKLFYRESANICTYSRYISIIYGMSNFALGPCKTFGQTIRICTARQIRDVRTPNTILRVRSSLRTDLCICKRSSERERIRSMCENMQMVGSSSSDGWIAVCLTRSAQRGRGAILKHLKGLLYQPLRSDESTYVILSQATKLFPCLFLRPQ